MTEIKIYDFDFNLIASDFKCISFDWDVRFNSIGSFEGIFTADSPIYDACSKNEFTICVQGENQGLVTAVQIKDDRVIISGKSMNYILEKRICMPFSSVDFGGDLTATEMACELVKKYCGDFMEVSLPAAFGEKREFTRLEARPLYEIISEILYAENCGHFVKVDLNNKKWIFGCIIPDYTDVVLSKPDNTLENCDYVRSVEDYALCGVYKQKMKYMGQWDAESNSPRLFDKNPENFAKAYLISGSGVQFDKEFSKGNYLVCTDLSGEFHQAGAYDDFWFKFCIGNEKSSLKWESILSCGDIKEAEQLLLLKGINENVIAITRGVNQKELKVGDVVQVRLSTGKEAMIFTKQVKKVVYHYEWGNCFIKPTFYKLKEYEDE